MSVWRLIAECPAFAQEKPRVMVGGLNPWDYYWLPVDEPEIIIPNNDSRSKGQWLRVYEIGDAQFRVRFAACLSANNKTFRFYVPAPMNAPGSFEAASANYEGHWRMSADESSVLPWPITAPEWTGRALFLRNLDLLESVAERVVYRGKSFCRLCGCLNGHEAFRFGVWEWPAGYRHYIAEHQVRPSEEFEHFVASSCGSASRTT
jgi:hypothetical protein